MFPEIIQFNGEEYRTYSYNKVLDWIFQNTNELQKEETEGSDKKSVSSVSVPGYRIVDNYLEMAKALINEKKNNFTDNKQIQVSNPNPWKNSMQKGKLFINKLVDRIRKSRRLKLELALGEEEWNLMQETQLSYIKEHGVIAIKLDGNGESDQPNLLWNEKDYVAEVPSLVKVGSRIYMIMDGGTVLCINSKTGKIVFSERIGSTGAYLASPLYANGYIYFAAYNGRITVIKPGDKLNVVARSDMKEKIASSPVALGKILYVRTDSALYAFKK